MERGGGGRGKQTVAQLSNSDIPRQVLIKHLEPAHELVRLAWITKAIRTIQDLKERLEVH